MKSDEELGLYSETFDRSNLSISLSEIKEQETLEEAACKALGYDYNDWVSLFSKDKSTVIYSEVTNWCKGAKWQSERMYSEEEVLKSADYLGFKQITSKELNSLPYQPFITDEDGNIWIIDKDKWFEQFKKK